jgi:LytS/YehU family sensor histidine kinase
LVVEDDGAGLTGATPEGIGLSATSHRLSELYGERGRLSLENGTNGGSRVIVEIPFRRASAAA